MAPHRPTSWRRHAAASVLLAALALTGVTAAAQKPEERFTPAPAPTVSLPRLTPLDGARAERLAPATALRPPPVVAPLVSPIRTPAAPSAAAPPQPQPQPQPVDPKPTPAVPPPAPPPPSAPREAPPAANASVSAPAVAVVTTAGVRLRAAPGTDARVLDTVEPGERLEAFGPAVDGWRRVGRKGKPLGYVAAAHLAEAHRAETKPDNAKPVPGERYAKADREDRGCALPDDLPGTRRVLPSGSVARVLADANLRVAPACDAKVEDVLEDGERVTILGATGSWYRVGRKGKPLGYVGGALLAPVKPR